MTAREASLTLLTVGFIAAAVPAARAQVTGALTTLHVFSGSDGYYPQHDLVQGTDGNFYGTTFEGGADNEGVVFRVTPAGVFTILYSFTGGTDGESGNGLVQGGDGNFYGTTFSGGTHYVGSVFRITPAGVLTTLYSFTDGTDGASPKATVILGSDGNFYGTTTGGSLEEYGTVFRMTPAGALTTLYSFSGGSDGASPEEKLVQASNGNFYGTTSGDEANRNGTAFEISPTGTLTTLHTFNGSDGRGAHRLVLGNDGNFYGTTNQGGSTSYGTVFQLDQTGALTTLYTFTGGSDGSYPDAGLALGSDGNFYGTTYQGGLSNNGTVFQITPAGALTTLYRFNSPDGTPEAGVIQGSDGNFYGTTIGDGVTVDGTIFELTVSAVSTHPAFFTGEISLGNGAYYLSFSNGNYFGYYSYLSDPAYIYHFDLGYEYVFDAADGNNGVYFYDFASDDFFYTSPTFPFPYLYDFGLNSVVYYYPDPNNPGHYNTNGVRYFYVFSTGQIISK